MWASRLRSRALFRQASGINPQPTNFTWPATQQQRFKHQIPQSNYGVATMPALPKAQHPLLPLELVDKCVGSQIWIIMNNQKEFVGTLIGFDDYVTDMVLEDVREIDPVEGETRMSKILLNGNNICMMVPGGDGEWVD
ncbi:hypothetical protein GRF29_1536g1243102 [Pseudopithomyces chartarum]|uniref:LSM complex subunit LSM5 n=1 Tax=Pseudopithomyces chartarum TaxID=1892770 RepID=A0AAN6LQP6_9PLEO|nr:hypothetical protein GRF29_1536g1243102 [Pseudopithomyces chartarum]